ncbi:hypothetical protein CBL_07487 [Carabus blaptoides fortunei]
MNKANVPGTPSCIFPLHHCAAASATHQFHHSFKIQIPEFSATDRTDTGADQTSLGLLHYIAAAIKRRQPPLGTTNAPVETCLPDTVDVCYLVTESVVEKRRKLG